VIGTRSTPAKT